MLGSPVSISDYDEQFEDNEWSDDDSELVYFSDDSAV
jgi:hypothetical protein